MSTPLQITDLLIEGALQIQVVRYTIVATVTLITYEYLITLNDEVCYLWRRRLGFAGGLLVLCRYVPFFAFAALYVYVLTTKVDESVCINGFRASAYPVSVELVLGILVLFTRAYAVWGGNRRIVILLGFVFVCATALIFYGESLYVGVFSFAPLRFGRRGCLFVVADNSPWLGSVILVFCESLALGLLLVKYIIHSRETKNILYRGGPRRNILRTMAHDGVVYFTFSLAFTTANIVFIARVTANDLRGLLFVIQGPIQVIFCARLLFHIRAVSEPPDEAESYFVQGTFVVRTEPERRDTIQVEIPANDLGIEMETWGVGGD